MTAVLVLATFSANASAPTLLGSADTTGVSDANAVAVSGAYAYVGTNINSGGPEFYVIDITHPGGPSIVGSREIGANVNAVVVAGSTAYLATGLDAGELVILDVASPAATIQAGSFNHGGVRLGRQRLLHRHADEPGGRVHCRRRR